MYDQHDKTRSTPSTRSTRRTEQLLNPSSAVPPTVDEVPNCRYILQNVTVPTVLIAYTHNCRANVNKKSAWSRDTGHIHKHIYTLIALD